MEFGESFSYITRKFNISNISHFENGFTFNKVENPGEKLREAQENRESSYKNYTRAIIK